MCAGERTSVKGLLLRPYRFLILKLIGGNGAYQAGLRYYKRGGYKTALEAFRDSEGMFSELGKPDKALPLIERAINEYASSSNDGASLLKLQRAIGDHSPRG